ncbi:MAG TPA: hypothetical protein VK145_02590, partial [Candidatus Nanoarchaeia archaeon]|nr:hypothetical protein [Candidatus Nanoarchaeia archaeon]
MKFSTPLKLTTVLLFLSFVLLPQATDAATFSAAEIEENSSGFSIPALTFANGANEVTTSFDPVTFSGGGSAVVASLRLVMTSMPNAGASVVIGDCEIDFVPAAGPLETNCSDNAATIPRISRDNAIAGILSLTNVTQNGTPLVVFSDPIDGSDFVIVSDTTGDVDTVVGPINFEEYTDFFQLYFVVTGNSDGELSAATATLNIPDALPANATDHSVEIDGLGPIDLGLNAATPTEIAQIIKEAIANSPGFGTRGYGVDVGAGSLVFTKTTLGN